MHAAGGSFIGEKKGFNNYEAGRLGFNATNLVQTCGSLLHPLAYQIKCIVSVMNACFTSLLSLGVELFHQKKKTVGLNFN
jgi:hypothetical protein